MRGLRFKIANDYGRYLFCVLEESRMESFYWKISETEIYADDANTLLFKSNCLSGSDFKEAISLYNYYIIFANLQAYSSKKDFVELKTYEDFINSKCSIIILISDCEFVEIYAKSLSVIEKIKSNAQRYNFTEIEYITEENDYRISLSVN